MAPGASNACLPVLSVIAVLIGLTRFWVKPVREILPEYLSGTETKGPGLLAKYAAVRMCWSSQCALTSFREPGCRDRGEPAVGPWLCVPGFRRVCLFEKRGGGSRNTKERLACLGQRALIVHYRGRIELFLLLNLRQPRKPLAQVELWSLKN